jgi:hypothetical protein
MIRHAHALLLATAAAALASCNQPPGHIGSGGSLVVLDVDPYAIDQLDILFVVDNSGSMEGQQAALVAAARDSLFGQLVADLGHLPDVHVGVVSTDMGTGGVNIGGCSSSSQPGGDDGALLTNACAGITGNFLIDEDDGAGGRTRNYEGDLADVFGCMAQLGTSGCGFEQPLAAAVRALDGSVAGNAGFVRDDAFLLVVIVADEDDCSTVDGGMFGDPNGTLETALGPRTSFRCFEFGVTCAEAPRELGEKTACVPREDSYMTPLDDLAARLRAVKADPSRIMVAGIHGGTGGVAVAPDPDDTSRPYLDTLCKDTDFEVTPAIRLSAFGANFPARWILTPECLQSTSAKIARITRATAGVLDRSTCLLAAAPVTDTCEVVTVSAAGARRTIPRCDGGGGDCYEIAPDAAACGYTVHQLRVVVPPALMPPGDRLQMRCVVP